MGLGPGRAPFTNGAERQLDRTHADEVAVNEPGRGIKQPARHEGSILAAKIFDRRSIAGDSDQGVPPGDSGRVEEKLEVGITTEDMRALAERHAAVRPAKTKASPGPVCDRIAGGGLVARIPKRIAESVDGPDEAGMR